MKSKFRRLLAGAALALTLPFMAHAASEKPNIVFIMG